MFVYFPDDVSSWKVIYEQTHATYLARKTFYDSTCDTPHNFWMGRTVSPHNVGFKIDLGCSHRVKKILLRNGYSAAYRNRQDSTSKFFIPTYYTSRSEMEERAHFLKNRPIIGDWFEIDEIIR